MNVDIVDILRLHSGVVESGFHSQLCAESVRMSGGEVIGIGRHTAAYYFCVDFGSAGFGVLEFLENEYGGTFTHHETVARLAEGARGCLGAVVARREGVH